MMNPHFRAFFFLVISLFFSSLAYAENHPAAVWTQKTLLETLTPDYTGNNKPFTRKPSSYSYNAWNALGQFLAPYRKIVIENKLSLHPQPIGPATIVESGTVKDSNFFSGVHYWRIHQAINVPELHLVIDFTALVIATQDGGYLITSIDMTQKEVY